MDETLGEIARAAMSLDPMRIGPVPVAIGEDAYDRFRALSSSHLDSAYRLAWAILGNDEDAADATQDAFAVAWRQRTSLRDPARFDAWLGRILINTCRDRLRQRARRDRRSGYLDPDDPPWIGDTSAATTTRDELDRALARLDADHRIVIVLRFWGDLPVDDIADRLGIPAGTVKSRLHHAIRALRGAIEETR